MYQLITKDTNFKKMRLYYSEYTNNTVYFRPIIRKLYVRTVKYYTDGVAELICEGMRLYIDYHQIPKNGTISIEGINTIISISKQEIAKFWKKQIFRDFPVSHFAYNNYDFTSRINQYKMCMGLLKKLT
jgi:hypothetical protein